MLASFEFAVSHHYGFETDGVEVPVVLRIGTQSVDVKAKVDTGSAHCIFERRYADMLGLPLESGRFQRFQTVSGSFAAYEHEVTLDVLGIEFSAVVFFAEDYAFRRSFVGRTGWLNRVRIAIIDYEGTLWLSPYGS